MRNKFVNKLHLTEHLHTYDISDSYIDRHVLGAFVLVKDTDYRVGNFLFSMWKPFFLPVLQGTKVAVLRPNPKNNMAYMGPNAGVDYNLTLCPLQSRLQHIYYGQSYARVDFIPQSVTLDLVSTQQGLRDPDLAILKKTTSRL